MVNSIGNLPADTGFSALLLLFFAILVILLLRYWRRQKNHVQALTLQIAGQSKELSALKAISAVVSNELGLQETLIIALQKTLQVMDVSAGLIFLRVEESGTAAIATVQGMTEPCINALDQITVSGSFLEPVLREGQSKIVSNLTIDHAFELLYACGFRRLAITPLTSRGIVLGALLITTSEPRVFSEQDLNLLTAIGGQIGVAIENSHFFKAEQHRAEQFRLIAAVGRRFSSFLDINQVLEQVVRLIQQTFGYYHVAIGLIEGEEVVYRMGAGPLWDDPDFRVQTSAPARGSRRGIGLGRGNWPAASDS